MQELFGKNNIGFDCASIGEMQTVRNLHAPIIYAQPCKTYADIHESQRFGARLTVVDSPEEVEKLGQAGYKGDTLIRLLVPDTNSKQPFGKKFGAPITWVPNILDLAKQYKIPVTGFSFHVGSECMNPDQFAHAIKLCKFGLELTYQANPKTKANIIDIGGGFLPDSLNLSAIASTINYSRHNLFPNNLAPNGKQLTWIAEPGRFLSSTSQILFTPIIGRKKGLPNDQTEFRYTLHESVYGYFSNIPFDQQHPSFEIAYQKEKPLIPRLFDSVLFGRTCDGADIINPSIKLPVLNAGDWLVADNMGAYTNVTASEFNGFPKPDLVYLE